MNIFRDSIGLIESSLPQFHLKTCVTPLRNTHIKADIELHRIITRHQAAYEKFICRVNEKFVNCFNQEETGIRLALHTNLRIHRSKGRSSKFFYGRLYDGIHPQKSLKTEWIKKIEKAIQEFYSK